MEKDVEVLVILQSPGPVGVMLGEAWVPYTLGESPPTYVSNLDVIYVLSSITQEGRLVYRMAPYAQGVVSATVAETEKNWSGSYTPVCRRRSQPKTEVSP